MSPAATSADRTISPFVERCFGEHIFPERALILDIPCGLGRHALWLAARGHCVIAADLDQQRVSAAALLPSQQDYSGRIHCLAADAEADLPFCESIFDVALVVHYYSESIVEKVRRCLKPGGHLIFETFGAQGQNWRSLPLSGTVARLLRREFEVIHLKETLAGPNKANAVVRALARRHRPDLGA